ncbi:MAG: tRNA (guanosine(37)-N1)-methyltransferase TrmD [Ruminococcaceae bacterium]|nr:tRNA (guanosine(37)-N1)-methyltransferase TrmD [Oscillospiraceae bacterium]
MRFDVLTLFPDMIRSVCETSIVGRASTAGIISVYAHNIRDYSTDKHRRVDDTPYGGGKGMLMAPAPVVDCHEAVKGMAEGSSHTVFLSPKGKVLTQRKAKELAGYDRLILLCGHYEGIDQRAIDAVCDEEISIGDYVLTGGELPACVLIDSVARLIPGVLAEAACHEIESISCGMLEYPQYTHPEVFRGEAVPEVLLSGNHREIEKWRHAEALKLTKKLRPDLL